jgi:hypothetical protein
MDPPTSLFERWIARPRRPWLRVGISVTLIAALPIAAALDGVCRALSQTLSQDQPTGTLPADLNALVIYEGRLKEGRTWPYNTVMLRTLVLSGLASLAPGSAASSSRHG